MPENKLFYGDNLTVLREHIRDETVKTLLDAGAARKTFPS
jgi:hypothetical protein